MAIVFVDTETTGLLEAEGNVIENQPYIIEIAAIKTDDDLNQIDCFMTYIKPPKPLPPVITKITGITDNDLIAAPAFHEIYKELVNLFFGCHTLVAHNLMFDLGMLVNELGRLKKTYNFPYPPIHYCTVEHSMHIKGFRLKLGELYNLATGKEEIIGAHRANEDTQALIDCYKFLQKEK